MAKKIAEGTALGLRYEIHDRTGSVDQSESRSETRVEGSVSGGGGVGGYTAPVVGSVTTKITNFQSIFLTDEAGKEHVVELTDFLVPVRPGQRLTMFLLTRGKREYGSYFEAYNHNTREYFEHPKAIRSEMYPWRSFLGIMGVVIFMVFLSMKGEAETGIGEALLYTGVGSLIIGAPLWVVGWVVSYLRSQVVRRNPEFKSYLGRLGEKSTAERPHPYEGSAHA